MSEGRPLQGYRMLDLSRYLPGPYCSMILADLGMEVLKVEEPKKGDPARAVGPRRKEDSVYFLAVNRNKRSIGINLSTAEGKEIFQRLCSTCDIVLENFKPGTMDRLGLGYNILSKVNPSLIYCSISGYGQKGLNSEKPGHDINYIASSGLLGLTRHEDGMPVIPEILTADLTGGLFASIGILTALIDRKTTGKGRYIDISMTDGIVSLLCYHIAGLGVKQKMPDSRETEFNGSLPFYNVYETSDGKHMAFGAVENSFWKIFCNTIGHPELVDKQWATGPERKQVIAELKAIFKTKTESEWKECFEGKEVCCDPVREIEHLFSDEQVIERRMIVAIDHPVEGSLRQSGNPVKLSKADEIYEPPPLLGEHTEEVLRNLGYKTAELSLLKEKGVI